MTNPKPRQRNRRRTPKPLTMPVFGQPYNGRQCAGCGRWFDRAHFWRSTGMGAATGQPRGWYVARCADCIRKNRRVAKNLTP